MAVERERRVLGQRLDRGHRLVVEIMVEAAIQ